MGAAKSCHFRKEISSFLANCNSCEFAMDDKNQQFSYFETGMKMSVKCVSLLGKAYEGRHQEEDGAAEENGRKMNESIQKLREGLYEYARQENEFSETVDAIDIVMDEINK